METVELDKRKCPAHFSSEECVKMLLPMKDAMEATDYHVTQFWS